LQQAVCKADAEVYRLEERLMNLEFAVEFASPGNVGGDDAVEGRSVCAG